MPSYYSVERLEGGYAVVMAHCRRVMEIFPDEGEALAALAEFERGERISAERPMVSIVGDFVVDRSSGLQLGEGALIDLRQFTVVDEMSQDDFDEEMEEFFREHGHYPGQ